MDTAMRPVIPALVLYTLLPSTRGETPPNVTIDPHLSGGSIVPSTLGETLPNINIDPQPPAVIGEPYLLICRIRLDYGTHTLNRESAKWLDNGEAVEKSTLEDRYRDIGNKTKGEKTLNTTIPSVDCSYDQHIYKCHVVLEGFDPSRGTSIERTPLNKEVTIIVKVSPENPKLTYHKPVIEGKSSTFTCTGNVGNPEKQLQMYMDDNQGNRKVSMPGVQTTKADPVTICGRIATLTVRFTVLSRHSGYIIVCVVEGDIYVSEKIAVSSILEYPPSTIKSPSPKDKNTTGRIYRPTKKPKGVVTTPTSTEKNTEAGFITSGIGIAVMGASAVLVLVGVVAGVFFCMKRRREPEPQLSDIDVVSTYDDSRYEESFNY